MRDGRCSTARRSRSRRCCRWPSASARRRLSSASSTPWSSILFHIASGYAPQPVGRGAERAQQLVDLHDRRVRRARGAGHGVRRADCVDHQRRLDDRGGRPGTAARQLRVDEHLRRDGRAGPARTGADGDRRAGGRAAGRGPRPSLLAAPVRWRSDDRRPDAAPRWRAARGHRRDAAALHVARRRRLPADALPARLAAARRPDRPCHGPPGPRRVGGAGGGVAAPDRRATSRREPRSALRPRSA